MKYINFTKAFASLALVSVLFASCDKKDEVDLIGDRGQTIVKVIDGGTPGKKAIAIDFVNTPTTFIAADIRRDVPNSTELNKTATVVIQEDTAAVRAAGFAHLPTAWYTLQSGAGVTKTGGQGGTYTVTFAPGQFAVPIIITIPNATLLDPSTIYGLAFKIISTDQGRVATSNVLITSVGAKNSYDGIYEVVSGTVTRYANPTTPLNDVLSGPLAGNPDIKLITTGAYTVAVPPAGSPGAFYWAAGTNSQVAGIDGVRITVDPATNLVTMLSLGNATLTNWPGKENRYDPATRTFYLNFHWNPAANKREYSVILKYKGPR